MAPQTKRKVLVIGGQFSGGFSARELKKKFHVTVVDAKEYFEYTPGVLRAFVKPAHFDALSFTLQPVLERKMGVKFIWGEVKKLTCGERGQPKQAQIQPMFSETIDIVSFDYAVICAGCNFGPFHAYGESLWFPTIHAAAIKAPENSWPHIDERFIEGRRRHILEEYDVVKQLNAQKAKVLIVGAGFIGVEWCTEIEYYFPDIELAILDFLPRPLGPLPEAAAEYCDEYMAAAGINQHYSCGFAPKEQAFWDKIGLSEVGKKQIALTEQGLSPLEVQKKMAEEGFKQYVCIGVKASNHFMPKGENGDANVLSEKGPGGGGWIHMNRYLQVTHRPAKGDLEGAVWGDGSVFAVGDCNYGCIGNPPSPDGKGTGWLLPPIPKISYPGEEQAMHACVNLKILDQQKYHDAKCGLICGPSAMKPTWWPWGSGMFATSLGPHDACFVLAANEDKGSGFMVNWWLPAAIQKEIIETTKVDEMKDNFIGVWIWHYVHHTPCNCWGRGPCCPCQCCPCC